LPTGLLASLCENVLRDSALDLARVDVNVYIDVFHDILIVSSAMGIPKCPELFEHIEVLR
jgi:hypothetical protein